MSDSKKNGRPQEDASPKDFDGSSLDETYRRDELDAILNALVDPIAIYDARGNFRKVNKALTEFFGFDPTKESRETFARRAKMLHTDGRAVTLEELPSTRALKGEMVTGERYLFTDAYGQRVLAETSSVPVLSDGAITGVVSILHNVTAQEKATEDVRESRRQVIDILESISDGFFALDSLWRVTYINKRAQELLGIGRIDILFRSLWDKLPNTQVLRLYKELTHAAEHKTALSFEEYLSAYDKWFEFHVYPYEHGVSVYFSDVTERKQAEEALKKSNQRFDEVLESIGDGFVVFDKEWRYAYLNEKAAEISQKSKEELLGRVVWDVFPDLVDTIHYEEYHRAVREQVPVSSELYYEPFGQWFEFRAYPFEDGLAAFVRDITERKRLERALRESEERYRTLFDEIDEGFCIIEVIFDEDEKPIDYRFLETNPAFEKQTGLIDAEGKRVRELVPGHEEHWFEMYGRVALTGQPVRFENAAAELHRWYDVYAFRFGRPEARHVAVLFNDITQRKRAEDKLARSVKRLETLHEITSIATSSLDIEEVSQRVLDSLGERFDLGTATVFLLDKTQTELIPTAFYGVPFEYYRSIPPVKVGSEYETDRVFRSGVPIIVEDMDVSSTASVSKEAVEKTGGLVGKSLRSYIDLPLKAYQKTIGTMGLAWTKPRTFTRDDIDFFTSIARAIAVGLENARLYEAEVEARKQTQSELDISNSLLKAAGALTKSTSLSEALDTLSRIITKVTQRSRITVTFLHKDKDELEVVASRGELAAPVGTRLSLARAVPQLRQAVHEKRTVIADFEAPELSNEVKKRASSYDSRLALIVPLIYGDEVIGQLGLDEPGVRREFSQREVRLVEGIAAQAAVAIENARLFDAQRETCE